MSALNQMFNNPFPQLTQNTGFWRAAEKRQREMMNQLMELTGGPE